MAYCPPPRLSKTPGSVTDLSAATFPLHLRAPRAAVVVSTSVGPCGRGRRGHMRVQRIHDCLHQRYRGRMRACPYPRPSPPAWARAGVAGEGTCGCRGSTIVSISATEGACGHARIRGRLHQRRLGGMRARADLQPSLLAPMSTYAGVAGFAAVSTNMGPCRRDYL
jgi:hypothetical protein